MSQVTSNRRSTAPSRLSQAGAVVLHTTMVYLCGLMWFPWLVGRWFAWVVPQLHVSALESAPDWYLNHVVIVNFTLASVVGYGMARGLKAAAIWAWSVPALVLGLKMIQFANRPSMGSVLFAGQPRMTAIEYFFGALGGTPFADGLSGADIDRVLMQMRITAAFCAGVGYSLGALVARYGILTKMFIFEKHQDDAASSEPTSSQEPGS